MKHNPLSRCFTLLLSFLLLLSPTTHAALTAEQAGKLLKEHYIDEIPANVLNQSTIDEMLEALGDPYTEYFTPQEYQGFLDSMSDISLVGIGVTFLLTEEGLLVEEVLAGSPAEKGGLLSNDLITAVDGHSVLGEDSNTISDWIQGQEGTQVSLTYHREGQKEKTVTLTRALVVIAATTTQLIDGHIGYIRCATFGDETYNHFKEGLETYGNQATVWIVDLRSNLGGSTDAATDSAGLFAGAGEMAYLRDGSNQYGAYVHSERSLTLYPTIVLVDQFSASSSELFASIIRDYQAGIVVGSRTFGKGVAQQVLDRQYDPVLFADGDALKITSHRFYSPAGNTSDQVGVIPDLLVDPAIAGDVAYLLAGAPPTTDTTGLLRIDMGWRWFVDTKTAAADFPEAFQALLQAIPDDTSLWNGTGGADGWAGTTPEQAAQSFGATYQAPLFPDQSDSQFPGSLSILKTYNLVHGKEDGNFHPKDTLTRAELCQLLAVALNCTVPQGNIPYTDVTENAWYTPAILAMTQMGLVNGIGDGTFRPEETVDHQQFITIMGRLAQRLNMYFYDAASEMPADAVTMPQLAAYDTWAQPSAWLLSYSQRGYFGNLLTLLWDSADHITPTDVTTRDEAAYTLYRLLSYTGILPV